MTRKDCERRTRGSSGWSRAAWPSQAPLRCADGMPAPGATGLGAVLLCSALFTAQAAHVQAGQLRVWSSAVVVADSIKLGDLAELHEIETSDEEVSLRNIVIMEAPPPGGSRIIHHEKIRAALSAKGVNLAKVVFSGASQCEVSRPASPRPITPSQPEATPEKSVGQKDNRVMDGATVTGRDSSGETLRKAIEKHFNEELHRYGGQAEVLFDRADDAVLELTGPLQFHIRREKSAPLGLCALEVEVIKDGRVTQQIPLVVRTALSRNVLTARRPINQGAALVAADVDITPVTFTRLDDLGLDDTALVLGQRAKRFIPVGNTIELESLEPAPLILRGQLITLISEVGGVRVVTTAKAGMNGMRGETIRVRSVDDNKVEIDAVVTGPGEARAVGGAGSAEESKPRLVMGGKP